MELNTAPTQDRGTIGLRVRFKIKKIPKESDRRENPRKASQKCMKIER
jgi:hypothetical protein